MAYNVLFISEQKLKDNTPITDNVDSSELRFAIQQAQAIQLQESLGTNLYEYLLQVVDDNTINTDPALYRYKGLLDNFIQPTLIAFSYYLSLDNFWVKFMNRELKPILELIYPGQEIDLTITQNNII